MLRQSGRLHRDDDWTNTAITQDISSTPGPIPFTRRHRPRRQPDAARTTRIAAGLPANFFVVEPGRRAVQRHRQRRVQRLPRAADRSAPPALAAGCRPASTTSTRIERGSAFPASSTAARWMTGGNVRHAIKTQWDWTVPVGRGQRFGADMHPMLDGVLGGWSINGVGRIQARMVNFGNVRLVGMTQGDCRACTSTTSGSIRPTGWRRSTCCRTTSSSTPAAPTASIRRSLTGYSALGVPEGRYIAPAELRRTASQLQRPATARRARAHPRAVVHALRYRRDQEVPDQGPHQLRSPSRRAERVQQHQLRQRSPDAGDRAPAIFQTTGFYDDPSNTYDPGGRLGQMMFRFNW